MSIEEIWYESSPYVYALAGLTVLAGADGALAKMSGGLLLIAAGTILRLRWVHRARRAAANSRLQAMKAGKAARSAAAGGAARPAREARPAR